jgi:hypothetical protein
MSLTSTPTTTSPSARKPTDPPLNAQLTSGQKQTVSIAAAGSDEQFYIAVPSSNMITCHTTSGSGNSDLYAKFGSQPTLSSYDALSNGGSTNEVVGPLNASTSDRTLYVMVYALTPIIDVELWCDLDYTTTKPTASSTTISPTSNLTSSTYAPTGLPTSNETAKPTNAPTRLPTSSPTNAPTRLPTSNQTASPTKTPTQLPTSNQTASPTKTPTRLPTSNQISGKPTGIAVITLVEVLDSGEPDELDDGFGSSVTISGTTAVIGAPGFGAAYVFEFKNGKWEKIDELIPSSSISDKCGTSVAVSENYALVGCPTNGDGASVILVFVTPLFVF